MIADATLGVLPPATSLPALSLISSDDTPTPSFTTATVASNADTLTVASEWANSLQLAAGLLPSTSTSSKASGMVFADGLTAIAARTVEKIQKGEYIDLADLLPGQLHNPDIPPLLEHLMYHPYAPSIPARKKKEINSPAQWALAFSTYISIVIDKEPGRARDLLAYQGMILKASEEGQREGHYSKAWLDYDIMFRRQAAVTKPEKWAQINNTIWNMCFLRSADYWTTCKSRSHKTAECTANLPLNPFTPEHQRPLYAPAPPSLLPAPLNIRSIYCLNWNWKRGCTLPSCKYAHLCAICNQPHKAKECSKRIKQPSTSQAGQL